METTLTAQLAALPPYAKGEWLAVWVRVHTVTGNEVSRLDVSSALSYREQIYAMFHHAEMFWEVVGGGKERSCIPETDS